MSGPNLSLDEFRALKPEEQKKTENLDKLNREELSTFLNDMTIAEDVRAEISKYIYNLDKRPLSAVYVRKHADGCPKPDYSALKGISGLFKIAAIVILILGLIATLYFLIKPMSNDFMIRGYAYGSRCGYGHGMLHYGFDRAILILLLTLWGTLVAYTISEVLRLMINVASDISHLAIHV